MDQEIKFHIYSSTTELSLDLECIPPCVLDVELQAPLSQQCDDAKIAPLDALQNAEPPHAQDALTSPFENQEAEDDIESKDELASDVAGQSTASPVEHEASNNVAVDTAVTATTPTPTALESSTLSIGPSADALLALQQQFYATMLQSQFWLHHQQQQQQLAAGGVSSTTPAASIPTFNFPFFPIPSVQPVFQSSGLHQTPQTPMSKPFSTVSVATITDQPVSPLTCTVGTQSIATTTTTSSSTSTRSFGTQTTALDELPSNPKPTLVSVGVGPDVSNLNNDCQDNEENDNGEKNAFDYGSAGAEVEEESPTLLESDREELTSLKQELAEHMNISAVPTLPTDTGSNYRPFYQYEDIREDFSSVEEPSHLQQQPQPQKQQLHPPQQRQQQHQRPAIAGTVPVKRADEPRKKDGFTPFKRSGSAYNSPFNHIISPTTTTTTVNHHHNINNPHHLLHASPGGSGGSVYNRDFSISSTQHLVSQRNNVTRATNHPVNLPNNNTNSTTSSAPVGGHGGSGGGQEIIARLTSHPEQSFIYSERDGSEWVGRKRGTSTDDKQPVLKGDVVVAAAAAATTRTAKLIGKSKTNLLDGHGEDISEDDNDNDDEAVAVEDDEPVSSISMMDSSNMTTLDMYSKSTIDYLKRYNLI
jgi:hypothetical protein